MAWPRGIRMRYKYDMAGPHLYSLSEVVDDDGDDDGDDDDDDDDCPGRRRSTSAIMSSLTSTNEDQPYHIETYYWR